MRRRDFVRTTAAGLLGVGLWRCGSHRVIPLVDGVTVPFLTPTTEHFVKNGAEGSIRDWAMPDLDPRRWSLTIDGLVDVPQTLTLADIEAESSAGVAILKTMQCVVDSGAIPGLWSTARWWGVPLRIFLDRAGVQSAALRLHLHGADGFTGNLPLERLAPDEPELVEPLLVTRMNGEPLPRPHGAPARLVIADAYGYANVKWLTRIEATADDSAFGTYQDAGFTDESRAPINSKLTSPLDNASLPAGAVTLHGFAVSGHGPIERVEVRIDDGPWLPARMATRREVLAAEPLAADAAQLLDPERFGWPLRGVWILWSLDWQADPGDHVVQVRAFDRAGQSQPELDLEIADGVNTIAAIRVEIT